MRGVVDGGGGRGVIWWDLNFEVWREAEHGEQRGIPLQSEQVMVAAAVVQRQQGGGGGSCGGFGRGIILRGSGQRWVSKQREQQKEMQQEIRLVWRVLWQKEQAGIL